MDDEENGNVTSQNIGAMRYVSLATFRKSGAEVRTPVWVAEQAGRFYVFSESSAGKVKRLRSSSRARVAKCDLRGKVSGPWIDANARIVDDPETIKNAYKALHRKYGIQMKIIDFFSKLTGRYQQRAMLEIVIAGDH